MNNYKNTIPLFNPGDRVQAQNRARWIGVVISVTPQRNEEYSKDRKWDIVKVIVIYDKCGNKQRKKFIREDLAARFKLISARPSTSKHWADQVD